MPTQILFAGEDSAFAARGLARLEDDPEFAVTSAASAVAALDHLERGTVSCIVAGTGLPDADLLAFLDGVRELSPDVPFVVLDGAADPALAEAVLARDATDYIDVGAETARPEQVARRVENAVARYRSEPAPDRASAYFDALVDQAPDAILTVDLTGRIVFANRAVERTLGYAPDELVGEPLATLIPERLQSAHDEAFERYLETGERTLDWDYIELPGRHRAGHEMPLALSFREVTYDGRRLFSAVVRDASERKRAEDERRLLHETTRAVATAETFGDGLEAAIAAVCDATEWAYGEAWVPGDDGALERADAAYTVAPAYEPFAARSEAASFAPGEGLPGRVWETGESVWMRDVSALAPGESHRAERAGEVGLATALGVPILDDGQVVAVLSFYMADEREADDRLVDLVTTVATELGALMARKRAEDDLKREQELVDAALDALPDLFFTLDSAGTVLRWNRKANDVLGYGDDELAGRPPTDFVPDEYEDRIADAVERVYAEGSARVEAPLRTKDGEEIPYEFTGALLEDDDGEPLGIAGTGRDVTERNRREAELEASRERYRRLVETAPDAIFIVEADTGRIVDTNAAAERLLDEPREEIVGMHQSELHPPDQADRYRAVFEEHVEQGGATRADEDYYVVRDDGREIPVEISAGITEIDGRRLNQAMFRDVTERRRREETLEALRAVTRDLMAAESREEICELAVETAQEVLGLPVSGVHLLDERAEVLRPAAATDEAERLFDGVPTFEAGEGLAWEVFEAGTPRLYEDVDDEPNAYNPDTPVRTEMILPLGDHGVFTSGSTESEHITESKLNLAKILAANIQTALGRAARERAIQRQRDELRAELDEVFERIDDGFFALDEEWRFDYVNERAERLLGATGAELGGRIVWEAFPELRESAGSDALRRAAETQEPTSYEEYFEPFEAWFEFHAYPSESGLSVYFRDVSERKEREQRLEQQNERLESFASMLAHELRNPLSIAQIYLQTARDGDDAAFDDVADALDRIEEMIDVLLLMTRGGDSAVHPERVSLGEVATDAWADLSVESASLDVEADVPLRVEPHHLRHLLENLLQNAVEHAGSEVTVRVGPLDDGDGFYVEDDGPGIPDDERHRVFEAGYTTADDGIGLGLTFIAQLADAYDWACSLTESAAGGARFEFRNVDVVDE